MTGLNLEAYIRQLLDSEENALMEVEPAFRFSLIEPGVDKVEPDSGVER